MLAATPGIGGGRAAAALPAQGPAGTAAPGEGGSASQSAVDEPDTPGEQAVPLARSAGLPRLAELPAEGAIGTPAMRPFASADRPPTATEGPRADGAASRAPDRSDAAREPQMASGATPSSPVGRGAPQPALADSREPATRLESTRPTDSGPVTPVLTVPVGTGTTAGPLPGSGAAGTAPTMAESQIRVPLEHPDFAPALGAQISLFARDGVQTARLQLNPAEMGPITVQISLDGSAARVDFQADLAGTRSVIEASLPALAGALQDAGMTLAGGGVSQQSSGQRQAPEPQPGSTARRTGEGGGRDAGASAPAPLPARTRGLVDLVA
jgi:flagellar hook-length control protein FliK